MLTGVVRMKEELVDGFFLMATCPCVQFDTGGGFLFWEGGWMDGWMDGERKGGMGIE